MASETPTRLLSYDDYAALDDGRRYEVLDGELVEMTPAPSHRHQRILLKLARILADHADAWPPDEVIIAPFDVVLATQRPATVLQPDLLYLHRERRDMLTAGNLQGAPSVVVEILSPSTARKDRMRKLALYARYGVPEVWFVPHEVDRVEVLCLQTDHYAKPILFEPGDRLKSVELPGLQFDVTPLFE